MEILNVTGTKPSTEVNSTQLQADLHIAQPANVQLALLPYTVTSDERIGGITVGNILYYSPVYDLTDGIYIVEGKNEGWRSPVYIKMRYKEDEYCTVALICHYLPDNNYEYFDTLPLDDETLGLNFCELFNSAYADKNKVKILGKVHLVLKEMNIGLGAAPELPNAVTGRTKIKKPRGKK